MVQAGCRIHRFRRTRGSAQAPPGRRGRRASAEKLAQADVRLIASERRWRDARESLAFDAEDLRLPTAPDALAQIERVLAQFDQALQALMLEAQAVRHALPELDRQRGRE